MRYRQETPSGSVIHYLDKLMEIEALGGSVDYRHYLGDVAILTKTGSLNDPSPGIRYTFRDRLGGISMLGDTTGLVTETRAYDAFGKPRNGNWTNKTPAIIGSSVTDRGFTDHEHLDDWQLIHMNGRGYDYNLGRFLSVDPFIQDPGNSQSINGFSYIMNNPLSATDPTGYMPERRFNGSMSITTYGGQGSRAPARQSQTGSGLSAGGNKSNGAKNIQATNKAGAEKNDGSGDDPSAITSRREQHLDHAGMAAGDGENAASVTLGAGNKFPSERAAAEDALKRHNQESGEIDREMGGQILKVEPNWFMKLIFSEEIYYTYTVGKGKEDSMRIETGSEVGEVVAAWHTHGGDSSCRGCYETFSGKPYSPTGKSGDIDNSLDTGLNAYLGTPRGRFILFQPSRFRDRVAYNRGNYSSLSLALSELGGEGYLPTHEDPGNEGN